jgi:predicted TIM-barrel fold metal-dependent hydrolase
MTSDRYTLISADTHAGGSHAAYREYLDPDLRDDFDAWREKYRNPFRDLGDQRRLRNWDNDMRNGQQDEDGVVGEVIFPNTVPPFFPTFVLFAPPPRPEDYRHRLGGIRAHNRWLADFCAEYPERRAGIGQVFLNDIDDALEDVRYVAEHGLRGGILLPPVPPDVDWIKPLNHPDYDRLWAVCEELGVPINSHGGTGAPRYAPLPSSALIMVAETLHYSRRPFLFMLLSGVFERFPRLKFVMTEAGCSWVPPLLSQLDYAIEGVRGGATGEIRYSKDQALSKNATEYFHQNVWMGVSQPRASDVEARHEIGIDRFMWGSDYPHDEGTHPYTKEHLRARFNDVDPVEVKKMLSENAAKLYDFDLDALRPLAQKIGPTVGEIATPIDAVPEKELELISGDMDTRAIK